MSVADLQSAQLENYDNVSLSVEYFEWLRFLNEMISHEIRQAKPNHYTIEKLSDIASHIANSNNILDIFKDLKNAKK